MKKKLNLIIFLCFSVFVIVKMGMAQTSICQERFDGNFINIQIAHEGPDTGINDVFQVVITPFRPKTEGAMQALKSFDFYSETNEGGGSKYVWKKFGSFYRLYKVLPSGELERVRLFVMKFPGGKKFLYLMKLMQANFKLYNDLQLNKKLNIIAVMGVTFEGTEGTVDFINIRSFGDKGKDKIKLGNVEAVMKRFAQQMDFEMEESEEKDFSDYMIEGPKEVLNNLSSIYESKDLSDPKETIVTKIGNYTLGSMPIHYIYLPCIPNGVSKYGPPQAVFIPLKLELNGNYSYPLILFPTAFTDFKTFNTALKRELYHAKVWNALANLSLNDTKQKFIYEFLLRSNIPTLELLIYKSMQKKKVSEGNPTLFYTLRTLFYQETKGLLEEPSLEQIDPIWTVDPDLILPETCALFEEPMVHSEEFYYYGKAILSVVSSLDSLSGQTIAGNNTSRGKFSKFTSFLGNYTQKVIKKMVINNLVEAILHGYTQTKEERTAALDFVLEYLPYEDFLEGLKEYPEWGNRTEDYSSKSLINKIKERGFQYDDLVWLLELMKPGRPLAFLSNETFGKRLKYLVETKKVRAIEGLVEAMQSDMDLYLGAGNKTKEIVIKMADEFINKAEDYLKSTNSTGNSTGNATRSEIEDYIDEVKDLKEDFEKKFKEYQKQQNEYQAEMLDYHQKFVSALVDVKRSCGLSSWSNDQIYEEMKALNSTTTRNECKEKINSAYKAEKERDKVLSEREKKVDEALSNATKVKEELVSKIMDYANKINYDQGRVIVNLEINPQAQIEKIPVKEWIRKVFEEYFTVPGDDEQAYQKLEEGINKINGIKFIKEE